MMTRRIGFTLVELLVVIAIVGVLVALLIPAVQSAHESARRMKCNSNLHQLGIGIQQYAQASGGHFPWTYHAGATNSWIVTVAPFLENVDEIRLCPDDPLGEARVIATTAGTVKGSSYVINEFVAYPTPNSVLFFSKLKQTSKLIILFEGAVNLAADDDHVHTSQWYAPGDIAHGLAWATENSEININAHGGNAANYLYADGHAETISADTIYQWFLQDCANGTNFAMPVQ